MYIVDDRGEVIEIKTERLNVNVVTKDLYLLIQYIITNSIIDEKTGDFTVNVPKNDMARLVQVQQGLGG